MNQPATTARRSFPRVATSPEPAARKARVWSQSQDDEVRVIALSAEGVYWHDLPGKDADNLIRELDRGEQPEKLFNNEATYIPLRRIERVSVDRTDDNDVDIAFRDGKERETETISVEDKQMRDEIFDSLQTALGPRMTEYSDQYSIPRSIFGSLVTLTVTGLVTWWLAAAAASIRAAESVEITGRKKGVKQLFVWALDLLGPWGVGVLGSLIGALVVFYLVHRYRNPPLMIILQSRPYKPASPVSTAIKYALLFAVWGWLVSIFLR